MRKSYQATSWSSPQWICEEKCLLSWLRYFERVSFLWKVLGLCQQLCFSVRRFLPTELSPSYFPRFPIRPRCPHFNLAPFQRNSPQAMSHGFPSVQPVVASISLPPTELCQKLLHGKAFTPRSSYTQKLLHSEIFTQRSLYTETFTQKLWHTDAFRQRSLDTRTRLQTDAFMHRSFFAQSSFTQRSLDTEKPVHTKAFKERRLLYREVLTQRSFYTEKSLQNGDLHTDMFTNRRFYK